MTTKLTLATAITSCVLLMTNYYNISLPSLLYITCLYRHIHSQWGSHVTHKNNADWRKLSDSFITACNDRRRSFIRPHTAVRTALNDIMRGHNNVNEAIN